MGWTSEDEALLAARDATEALRNLYDYSKTRDRKYSMAYLAKISGLSSSGYVSDLMSGRRRIQVEQSLRLAKVFRLGKEAKQLFRTLIKLEHEKESAKRASLLRRREVLTKALRIGHRKSTAALKDMTTAFEVFCAFGLFANRPTLDNLVDYFGSSRREEISEALNTLRSMNLVNAEGKHWKPLVDHIIFGEDSSGLSHINFLKDALVHASRSVEDWFPRKEMAYFTSTIISVKKQHYQAQLEDLRSKMVIWQTDLESGEADSLVRVNLQVYPIRPIEA